MKKLKYLAAGIAVMGMLFAGCNSNPDDSNNSSDKISLKVINLDNEYESDIYGKTVSGLYTDKENLLDSDVNTVLASTSTILNADASVTESLAKLVSEGKNLVVFGPTVTQMRQICEKLSQYEINTPSINGFLNTEDSDTKYRTIALRGNDVAYVYDDSSLTDTKDDEKVVSEAASEGRCEEVNEAESGGLNGTDEDADDILMASALGDWIDDICDENTSRSVDAKDYMTSQQFTHIFTAKSYYDVQMTVTVVDDIWPMCSIDNKTDYYVVHQSITCPNNQLGYKNTWDSDKKIGPYFRRASVEYGHISGAGNSALNLNISPTTSTGSTSHTSGVSFNIGGNVGFNASGPTGGISSGISFSESTSRSIPDISITYNENSDKETNWDFEAPRPDTGWDFLVTYGKDSPEIARNTAIFDTYCIYEMPSADAGNSPVLYSKVSVRIEDLYGELSGPFNSTLTSHYLYNKKSTVIYDHIAPPSRYAKDYIMGFEAPSDLTIAERDTLSKYLDSVFGENWKNSKTYYTVKEGDGRNVSSDFYAAMTKFNNNKTELKNKGFSGEWTFYVKAKDAADQNYISSQKITF